MTSVRGFMQRCLFRPFKSQVTQDRLASAHGCWRPLEAGTSSTATGAMDCTLQPRPSPGALSLNEGRLIVCHFCNHIP